MLYDDKLGGNSEFDFVSHETVDCFCSRLIFFERNVEAIRGIILPVLCNMDESAPDVELIPTVTDSIGPEYPLGEQDKPSADSTIAATRIEIILVGIRKRLAIWLNSSNNSTK